MTSSPESFQVFVKPTGSRCNLRCGYCYYLDAAPCSRSAPGGTMSREVLEVYIREHIRAFPDPEVFFSWHGGEPTLAGLHFFEEVISLQRKYLSPERRAINGIQTNGTLLHDDWCRFFAREGFVVGLSIDGPESLHNQFRRDGVGHPSFQQVMAGLELLQKFSVPHELLCVVHAGNVRFPHEVYGFLKGLGTPWITFLPLVIPPLQRDQEGALAGRSDGSPAEPPSVSPEAWGNFLCAVFDEWQGADIGRVKIQMIEEALRTAFGQEHSLCVFRPECGRVPVVEQNGDFYPCDHYTHPAHRVGNILQSSLWQLLEHPHQKAFGRAKKEGLTPACVSCEVLDMCNGACPKDRFVTGPDGTSGHQYLCGGYRKFFQHIRPFVREVSEVFRTSAS